jgi:hypothetical protein
MVPINNFNRHKNRLLFFCQRLKEKNTYFLCRLLKTVDEKNRGLFFMLAG